MGSSAPPRTCSCTRGRLAKNIPERVTVVAAGIDEDIRTREKVNTFFHFFEKKFRPSKSPPTRPPQPGKQIARKPSFHQGLRAIRKSPHAEIIRGVRFYRVLQPMRSFSYSRALRPSKNCTITSYATGIIETTMMPSTTASKCFFTQSIWPKITPAIIIRKTQRKLPTTV